jgi:hypothetical protein
MPILGWMGESGEGEGCGAGLHARGAPTMKQWSLDART